MNGRTKVGREKGLSANVYSLKGQDSSGQALVDRARHEVTFTVNSREEGDTQGNGGMGDLSVILESKEEHVS